MDLKQNGGGIDVQNGSNNVGSSLDGSQQNSDLYFCSRCDQKLKWHEKEEHEDWHFAKDLQSQEQDGAGASARPTQAVPQPQRPISKQAADSKDTQPPDYAPPSYPPPPAAPQPADSNNTQPSNYAPPSYPPPTNGASRAAARHHTNQVIEAGKVRARDEVRSTFSFTR